MKILFHLTNRTFRARRKFQDFVSVLNVITHVLRMKQEKIRLWQKSLTYFYLSTMLYFERVLYQYYINIIAFFILTKPIFLYVRSEPRIQLSKNINY